MTRPGLLGKGLISESPLKDFIAAVSVGIYKGKPVLDLDYPRTRIATPT